MSDQNSIPKAIENFVVKGGIARSETHVDYSDSNNAVVTWSLSDEPELATTPSVHVRRINDVRQILRLKQNIKNLYNSNMELQAMLDKTNRAMSEY